MFSSKVAFVEIFKWICYFICIIGFIVQMVYVGNQYQQEMTVTSVSFEKAKTKKLPLLTVCPNRVLKSPIYPVTVQQFEDNIYKLEDLFSNRSLNEFANTSLWNVQNIDGPLIGKCHTFQNKRDFQSHDFSTIFYFNRTLDFSLYIHKPGIIIWYMFSLSKFIYVHFWYFQMQHFEVYCWTTVLVVKHKIWITFFNRFLYAE